MTRKQLNLALAVVAIGLLAAVLFAQKKDAPKKLDPLTSLNADAIDRIELIHPGKPAIQLERKDKAWALTAPIATAADPLQVAQILDLASQPIKQTFAADEVTKGALGLDPPSASVHFNDTTIDLGGTENLSYGRYVDVGGKISLIDDPAPQPFDEDYSDLVAKTLLPTSAVIDAVELPGLSVRLSADSKTWQAEPASDTATPASLAAFVDAWHSARALFTQFTAEPGKGDPVTITADGGETIHLLIVAREPRLILERPDLRIRYVLDKSAGDKLLKITPPPAPAASPSAPPSSAAPAARAAAKP